MKLQDRVALITGGSSGIGRAAAVARAGAKVALTARRAERCQEAVEEIEGMAEFVPLNIDTEGRPSLSRRQIPAPQRQPH